MANSSWVYVERFRGHVRRVTLLDADFQVIAMHDRGDASANVDPDECQLLRAIDLERRSGLVPG